MAANDPVRVLVIDGDESVLAAYRELLAKPTHSEPSEVERLRARLFKRPATSRPHETTFEVHTAQQAEAGVEVARAHYEKGVGFDVAFVDMRMPPGRDGAWAIAALRELDPSLDVVIATSYSDVDPARLADSIPPADKLFYLQKPFHPHEVRQMALALGRKARAEAQLRRLAYEDPLTGLPNRASIQIEIERALANARATRPLGVLWVDLDHFKRINDTLGHRVGDEVLQAVAERLKGAVEGAAIARLGSDEFLVLAEGLASRGQLPTLAARCALALEKPIEIGAHRFVISPSIGGASAPGEAHDVETLLRNADLAMHFAKRSGRASYQDYDAVMNEHALKQLTLEAELRRAIERGELSLAYQPQLSLRTGRVAGMEALLRWNSRTLGAVSPPEFIPLAEETGLIHAIGSWALDTACATASRWIAAGLPLGRIAVNVSAVQLARPDFLASVEGALERSGLAPSALELEITETALVDNLERAREMLARVRALGVQIAIDDFGVGYSNMAQLKQLAVDRVKIDRSLVTGIDSSERDRAIAVAILAMAREMDLRVTAEGVEDAGQLEVLEAQACDEIQGLFVARPMSEEQADAYLRAFLSSSAR